MIRYGLFTMTLVWIIRVTVKAKTWLVFLGSKDEANKETSKYQIPMPGIRPASTDEIHANIQTIYVHMYIGVSTTGGTPKWLVHRVHRQNPIKLDDLRVPLFQETSIWGYGRYSFLSWKLRSPPSLLNVRDNWRQVQLHWT